MILTRLPALRTCGEMPAGRVSSLQPRPSVPRSLNVFEEYTTTFAKRDACIRDATQEFGMVLDPIVDPVVLRGKPDQHAGRTTVPRDDDFLLRG